MTRPTKYGSLDREGVRESPSERNIHQHVVSGLLPAVIITAGMIFHCGLWGCYVSLSLVPRTPVYPP